MKAITIRGIDPELENRLRRVAGENADSLNATILKLLRRTLGLERTKPFPTYHDLDDLAGTWSAEDEHEFNSIQTGFEKVDEELWK